MRRKERNSLTGDLAQMIIKDAGSYGLLTEDLRLRSSLSDVAKAVFIEKLHTAIKKERSCKAKTWKELAPILSEDADQLEAALSDYYRGIAGISQGVQMQLEACFQSVKSSQFKQHRSKRSEAEQLHDL